MDNESFRTHGKAMVDFIADYFSSFRERAVVPSVSPGYLRPLLPTEPPQTGEPFEQLMRDIEPIVLTGVTNWHHPQFHAYYPAANSFPSILADMLSDAIGCIGFSWIASPSCTELETVMMDWLAKALHLPEHFQFTAEGRGGGVIQGSASEAVLVMFMTARNVALQELMDASPGIGRGEALDKLVAYTSDQSHSSVERAAMLSLVKLRKLPTDASHAVRSEELSKAVQQDLALGLKPIITVATLGTTPSCAFDRLDEIGPVCEQHKMWLHVDAAYAGAALICEEFHSLATGLEYADSFNFNPGKWLQVTFDCSALWLKDSSKVVNTFNVDPLYLQHEFSGLVPDYRHWQIPLGRRFRSLKIWFVMRTLGVEGLQAYIRKHVRLAKQFEQLINDDPRFEIVAEVVLGLVCFRLKNDNDATKKLYAKIRSDGRIHLVPSEFEDSGTFFLRFAVCSEFTEEHDVKFAYDVICQLLDDGISEEAGGDDCRMSADVNNHDN